RRDGVDAIRRARGAAHSNVPEGGTSAPAAGAAHGNVPEGGNIVPAAGAAHGNVPEGGNSVPAAVVPAAGAAHGNVSEGGNIVPAAGPAGVGSELVSTRRRQARKSLGKFTKRWRSGRDSNRKFRLIVQLLMRKHLNLRPRPAP